MNITKINNFRGITLAISLVCATLAAGSAHAAARTAKVVIPEGTRIALQIDDVLTSETSHKGDTFKLSVAEALSLDGRNVIATGAKVEGTVTMALAAGRLSRAGRLGLDVTTITINGQQVEVRAVRAVADGKEVSKPRRLFSKLASPVTRVVKTVANVTKREILGDDVQTAIAVADSDGEVRAKLATTLGLSDPLASVELGGSSRGEKIASRSLNVVERVGSGYVSTILGGPVGLLKKGSILVVPPGTRLFAEVISETTVTVRR